MLASPKGEAFSGRQAGAAKRQSMTDFSPDKPCRYFSQKFQKPAVKVGPCQLYITRQMDEVLETILGSCIAACVRDPAAEVAGINHFMLPETHQPRSDEAMASLRYGNHAMDMLIEGLIRRGAQKERLEIKVFGGANVTTGPQVGFSNATWVLRYLAKRGLPVAAQHLGGKLPRSLHYFPQTGLVLMQQLESKASSDASAVSSKTGGRKGKETE